MAITGRDIAILSARAGVARAGASRFGFCPDDVEGAANDEPGEYIWKEHKPDTTSWTLQNPCATCPDICVASFTATPTSGNAPLSVAFTDTSVGEVTFWHWTFGDGGTSNEQNPTHIYLSSGTFTVNLWVSGPGGSDGPAVGTITVVVPGVITGTVYAGEFVPQVGVPVDLVLDGNVIDSTVTNASGVYVFALVTPDIYVVDSNGFTNTGTLTSGATLVLDIQY